MGLLSIDSVMPDILDTEQKYGLPAGYLSGTLSVESGDGKGNFNPNASNPSGAEGPFQFVPSTAKQYGLTDPTDFKSSLDAAGRLGRDNMARFTSQVGHAPNASELYVFHQQGAGGGTNLFLQPSAKASDLVGSSAVTSNGGDTSMTGRDFVNHIQDMFNRKANIAPTLSTAMTGANLGGGYSLPSDVSGTPGTTLTSMANPAQAYSMPAGTNAAPAPNVVPTGSTPTLPPGTTLAQNAPAAQANSWQQRLDAIQKLLGGNQQQQGQQQQKPGLQVPNLLNASAANNRQQQIAELARQMMAQKGTGF